MMRIVATGCKIRLVTLSVWSIGQRSMSTVSSALVKELREKSGAPMMDCKKALEASEVSGDLNKAMDWLRAKGKARAASNADRAASEGVIAVWSGEKDSLQRLVMLEVNSETDFVSRNKHFQSFVSRLASSIGATSAPGVLTSTELMTRSIGGSQSVQDAIGDLVNVIRENIVVRRAVVLQAEQGSLLCPYVHGKVNVESEESGASDVEARVCDNASMGRTASVVTLSNVPPNGAMAKAGRKLAMHVVAASPMFLSREDVPAALVESETAIFREQTLAENQKKPKPADVVEKIVVGKVSKRLAEICLLNQSHVAEEGSPVIERYLTTLSNSIGRQVKLSSFVKWTLGQQ